MLARALKQGVLTWSALREPTRVAVPDTQQAWLEVAQGKTIRQLEDLVAGRHLGDTPTTPSDPSARRHILRFEVGAETFALVREALVELRRRAGSSLDDNSMLLEMARCVLTGPSDEGRASYQIALTVCESCGADRQGGGGDGIVVSSDIVDMASCDGQHIGHIRQRSQNDPASHLHTTQPENDAEGSRSSSDAPRGSAHVGAAARAKQHVPPAVRRSVLRRDNGRCRVPGCRNAIYLDVHHIVLRSEGGTHQPDNILTVCGAHHRALHRGELSVTGGAESPSFRHADGMPYGEHVEPRALDVQARIFGALRGRGLREGAINRARAELRTNGFRDMTAEGWLRAAIQRLTEPTAAS